MSRPAKVAFTISSITPEVPKNVSNGDHAPLTVHVGKPAPKPAPVDPVAEQKKAAAEAVRKKARASVKAAQKIEKKLAGPTAAPKPMAQPTPKVVAKPQALAPQTAPVVAQPQPQPQPQPQQNVAPQVQKSAPAYASASAVVTYAAVLGQRVELSDAIDALSRTSQTQGARTALAQAGLEVDVSKRAAPEASAWPALAVMSTGHVVLVVSQTTDAVELFDPQNPEQSNTVPLNAFKAYFEGTVLHARKTVETLAQNHVPLMAEQHWFWGHFSMFKKQIGEIALGSLVANILAVAVALFSLQVYDRVIPHQSASTLWVLALGVVLAIVFEAVLKLARARLMDGSGRMIELKVQSFLMDRLLGMRSDARPTTPSGLFSAMREFGSVREFFTSSTIGTVADIPFIIMFFALVASISGPVVFIVMLGAIAMVLPGYLMQKRMLRLTQETQGASMKSSRLLHEVVFELDTIKTQRGESRIRRLWDELNVLSAAKSSEQRKLGSVLTYWSQAVQQITYVLAVVAGAYLVFSGEYTVGTIIATGILTSRTLAPLTQLAGTMAKWTNVKTALEGLEAIAQSDQDVDPARTLLRRPNLSGHYALRDVQFNYEEEGAPTLDLPKFDIKAGQKIALLGANGSGKSTFLKLLAGLYAPERGRLLIDHAELSQVDPSDVRRAVGYLGQDVRLFAGTLRENLNMGDQMRSDEELLHALDFAGLGPFVRGHHRGLDMDIRDGGEGLSGGQRQSIGWARLWLQDPQICLLDEPTAAFDQSLESALIGRLQSWLGTRTTVIATHRMPILTLAERVMVFHGGRIMVDGPRDEVLAHMQKGATS